MVTNHFGLMLKKVFQVGATDLKLEKCLSYKVYPDDVRNSLMLMSKC